MTEIIAFRSHKENTYNLKTIRNVLHYRLAKSMMFFKGQNFFIFSNRIIWSRLPKYFHYCIIRPVADNSRTPYISTDFSRLNRVLILSTMNYETVWFLPVNTFISHVDSVRLFILKPWFHSTLCVLRNFNVNSVTRCLH